jgi:Cdc6-like AAA superfamily ATPase
VWVVGERQVGKTSLLQRIERLYRDSYPIVKLYGTDREFKVLFIYFNCQIIRDDNGFYRNLTQSFTNHFDFKMEEEDNPYESFINWLKNVYEKRYYIIFLLDEFDAFIEKFTRKSADDAAHFLDTFNVLKQDIPGLKDKRKAFGVVCAANCAFGELTETLDLSGSGLNFVQEIELPNFTKTQVRQLANQYLEENQIQFSESEIQFCYEMTHGYPLFTQNLFSIMYEEKRKDRERLTKDFLKVVKNQYGKAFKKVVEEWEKQKKLTHRTVMKIQDIAKDIKGEVKDISSAVITKIIEGN